MQTFLIIEKANGLCCDCCFCQEWPTQRWSGVWTGSTGCRGPTAVQRNCTRSWWRAGSRSLRSDPLLTFCRPLSMTSSLPPRDNTRNSLDHSKKKKKEMFPSGTEMRAKCSNATLLEPIEDAQQVSCSRREQDVELNAVHSCTTSFHMVQIPQRIRAKYLHFLWQTSLKKKNM